MTAPAIAWRKPFSAEEAGHLHAQAFGRATVADIDWWAAAERYSLGWVTARTAAGGLVGFCNVLTDGHTHAWLQDVVVDPAHQRMGIGQAMIERVASDLEATEIEWLHVDFDDEHHGFYIDACGFRPAAAGLRPID